ncbi:MAG: low molecular weight phosphotyrosine protein phosphatase [Flavobacteriaceae bacterium]|nr:MAG: low molecular weight phosphotyrosine protein phosphatase [Flavobacteriaceae bacterium]
MTRILMVCLGNICRSPLAEGILRSKLTSDKFFVDSAGTAGYHIGNAPDPRSIAIANHYGLDISTQKCRQFTVSDFDLFDHIFVMDVSNYSNVVELARNSKDISKVSLILDQSFPNEQREVPDPYYGGEKGFDNVYHLLNHACDYFVENLS